MATVTIPEEQVQADFDDVWTQNPDLLYARSGLNILRVGNSVPGPDEFGATIGMRFITVPIPQGANIISASFTVKAASIETADDCKTEIQGEGTDDAAAWPASRVAFVPRFNTRTTAKVLWDPVEHFTTNVEYTSPDIKSVIQEIIDRPGWSSGNDLAIFWHDWDGNSDAAGHRNVWAHEFGAGNDAPKFNCTYGAAGQIIRMRII